MYECIAGHPPFAADTGMEIMYKHMSEPPPALLSKSKSSQSMRLSTLVSSCMQKQPEARPESISSIASELKDIFSTDIDKLDLFGQTLSPQKRRKPIAIAIFLFLLLAAGVIGMVNKIHSEQKKYHRDQNRSAKDTGKNELFSKVVF